MQKVISNRKLKVRTNRKTNPELEETINSASAHESWRKVAKILSGSTRGYSSVNLSQIDENTKEGDTVLILGKVLSSGDLSKKVRIVSLSISHSAKEKLKKTKSEWASIKEEIKINNKGEGIKLLR